MQNNQNCQVILISSKQKAGKVAYEVQKEGVLFLRNFKNKKFRTIFNIIPIKDSLQNFENQQQNLTKSFNKNLFMEEKCVQSFRFQNLRQQTKIRSHLTLFANFKCIQNNRVLMIMNAFLNQNQSPKLVIFGYLIASVIFYHNWDIQFSQDSILTRTLCEFGSILRKTDIDKLNQNIKYKTGYNKTPYFLCLIGKSETNKGNSGNERNYLNQFYRFQSQRQNSKINCALQTIIDFFPERSSLGLQIKKNKGMDFTLEAIKHINQLGNQFERNIVGRQMFNFEFTGTTIENLSFQLCQIFNSQKQINLTQIYNKVILNKKSRTLDQSIKFYLSLIQKQIFLNKRIDFDQSLFVSKQAYTQSNSKSVLPLSQIQLSNKLAIIKQQTFHQASIQALNCMNLQEYIITNQKLTDTIKNYQKKICNLNFQIASKFVNECYQILDTDKQQFILKTTDDYTSKSELVIQIFNFITSKIEAFSNQCLSVCAQSDKYFNIYNQTFLRIIRNYFQKLSMSIFQQFKDYQMQTRKNKLQISSLKYQIKKLNNEKKKIQQKYQFQQVILQEYKNKVKSYMIDEVSTSQGIGFKNSDSVMYYCHSKQYFKMKKQIEQLQQQVKDKNNYIEELLQILQKFEQTSKKVSSLNLIQRKNDKFNEQTLKLIGQANSKIIKFYEILQEVKNVEKQYESTKKLLMKEREKVIEEKKESTKQILQIKEKNQQLRCENEKLQEVISIEKQALQKLKEVRDTLKENIDQLETGNGNLTCALAETQGQLEVYRKAVLLVVEKVTKGKSESLQKFYKFLQHQELKQIIKPIVLKK